MSSTIRQDSRCGTTEESAYAGEAGEASSASSGVGGGSEIEDVCGRQGHSYEHVSAYGYSRQHNGNQVINVAGNYAYYEASASPQREIIQVKSAGVLISSQQFDLQVGDVAIAAILGKIFEVILLYILDLVIGLRYQQNQLPPHIIKDVAYFENAYGKRSWIDIDFVPNWSAFESLLCRQFEKRGYRKIEAGDYRLQSSSDRKLIHPRSGAEFKMVFKPGTHVRMSIYFNWDEVGHHGCPKCRSEHSSRSGIETLCPACKFVYTPDVVGEVITNRVRDMKNDLDASTTSEQEYSLGGDLPSRPLLGPEPDRPADFNFVSIGAAICDGCRSRVAHACRMRRDWAWVDFSDASPSPVAVDENEEEVALVPANDRDAAAQTALSEQAHEHGEFALTTSRSFYQMYLSSVCQRRQWPPPHYNTARGSQGYFCAVRVNGREYCTDTPHATEDLARSEAAMKAFMICRNFSAHEGMMPTRRLGQGSADGAIQGSLVAIGTGRRRDRNSTASSDRSTSGRDSVSTRESWTDRTLQATPPLPRAVPVRRHQMSDQMCLCRRGIVRVYGRCARCLEEAGWGSMEDRF